MPPIQRIPLIGLPPTGYSVVTGTDKDDGWYQVGNISNAAGRFRQFTQEGGTLVYDVATGLTWPRAPVGAGLAGSTYANLILAVAAANVANFGGYNDWRIPNILEVLSLIDFNIDAYAGGDGALNIYTESGIYLGVITDRSVWTSTGIPADPTTFSYQVHFGDSAGLGNVTLLDFKENISGSNLCVRGGLTHV